MNALVRMKTYINNIFTPEFVIDLRCRIESADLSLVNDIKCMIAESYTEGFIDGRE